MNPSLHADKKENPLPGRVIQTDLSPIEHKRMVVPDNTMVTQKVGPKTPSNFDNSPEPYVAPVEKKGPLLHISAGLKRAEITPPPHQAAPTDGKSSAQEEVQYMTAQSKFNESEFYSVRNASDASEFMNSTRNQKGLIENSIAQGSN